MVKFKYDGNVSPCKIKVAGGIISNLNRGDIIEVSDSVAEILSKNKYFKIINPDIKKSVSEVKNVGYNDFNKNKKNRLNIEGD